MGDANGGAVGVALAAPLPPNPPNPVCPNFVAPPANPPNPKPGAVVPPDGVEAMGDAAAGDVAPNEVDISMGGACTAGAAVDVDVGSASMPPVGAGKAAGVIIPGYATPFVFTTCKPTSVPSLAYA